MKMLKNLLKVLMAVLICVSCFACTDNSDKEPEPDLTPAELSEKAMDNFVRKLEKGNYVVSGGEKAEIHVVSPEQAYINYPQYDSVLSYVFMTLKNETFTSDVYDDEKIQDVSFVSTDNVIDYLGDMLPNSWITMTEGNMWELFYNDVNKPLEFTTNDARVKKTLGSLGGYNSRAVTLMEEVRVTMDDADPNSVHFAAVIPEDVVARIDYPDLDLTLTFGSAKSDARIEEWLKTPVYPHIRNAWTKMDIAMIENVFMREYGEEALPFPELSSYAMIFDEKAYDQFRGIYLTDSHWSEEDVNNYKELLRSKGFEEVDGTLADGSSAKVWRHLLRDEYRAYSQLFVNYDNGLEVEGTLYHDNPEYTGLAAISDVVQKNGFAPLGETDVFSEWKAVDTAASQTEGWAYFFDYNLYMRFELKYKDFEAAKAYLRAYEDKLLENGFIDSYAPGQINGKCKSPDEFISFEYRFDEEEDGVVGVEFSNEKSLTLEQVINSLKEHDMPETELTEEISARDHTRYYHELLQFKGLHIGLYQPFESVEKAEKYLDVYIPELEEQGYVHFDPQKVGSQRSFCWFNEEKAKYVAFDVFGDENSGTIYFEFVSIEPEEESLMMQAIRR